MAAHLAERSMFGGEHDGLAVAERHLDGVEADLALARGKVLHARFLADRAEDQHELELFERAARLYRAAGDARGEGAAWLWAGLFHQVVRGDEGAALPLLERAGELGDSLTVSYALRHLAIADHGAGRFDEARGRFEESNRLRRELGFLPGVAANLVGLAYVAAAQGDREEGLAFADEAARLAAGNDASVVARMAEQARAEISS
ncbi:tetratricopeptide repeat protein [Actinoplanes sp. NPDC049265]|uniref:tetratricopeptide repeat protein n=1 Tax=Actinoplanes sp. NPDC049265 TaxID=3363902 RepID=UPI003721CD92